jgi:glycosyltransferase involved in cell wall biosynthesis
VNSASFCVIIPAYNEQSRIAPVVAGARKFVRKVIVVDDGSTDETSQTAFRAGAAVIRHSENCGKGEALRTGFSYARARGYSAAVVMDADGQHDTQEIVKLATAFERYHADVVIGSRMKHPTGMPLTRQFTNHLMSVILSILVKKRCSDTQSGFRVIDLTRMGALPLKARRFDWESEFFIRAVRAGMTVREVEIRSIYSGESQSKIKVVPETVRFIILVVRNIVS